MCIELQTRRDADLLLFSDSFFAFAFWPKGPTSPSLQDASQPILSHFLIGWDNQF